MEIDEFSSENLLMILDQIKDNITNNQLPIDSQKELWNFIFWDKNNSQNKELISCMFVGWFIREQLRANKISKN